MSVRKCGTCKHYEPAPIWRRGWCRNPTLYSPQQSHLVGEDDLDCDRGMGNHWEAIERASMFQHGESGSFGHAPSATTSGASEQTTGNPVPIHLSRIGDQHGGITRRGGDVSQFGGSGRPSGPGGFGSGGGGNDEERGYPPYGEPEGGDPERFVPGRQYEYQVEERYWTDYLRIAAPVLGVILMLGLVWFWVASLLDDREDEDVDVTPDVSGPVIVGETPTPNEGQAEGDETPEPPLAVTTPTPEEPDDAPEQPAELGPGATVVVSNTDGAGLNMRAAPSTTADVQQELSEGAQLTITGESVEAEGYTWWPVESAESSGFVVADFLTLSE